MEQRLTKKKKKCVLIVAKNPAELLVIWLPAHLPALGQPSRSSWGWKSASYTSQLPCEACPKGGGVRRQLSKGTRLWVLVGHPLGYLGTVGRRLDCSYTLQTVFGSSWTSCSKLSISDRGSTVGLGDCILGFTCGRQSLPHPVSPLPVSVVLLLHWHVSLPCAEPNPCNEILVRNSWPAFCLPVRPE